MHGEEAYVSLQFFQYKAGMPPIPHSPSTPIWGLTNIIPTPLVRQDPHPPVPQKMWTCTPSPPAAPGTWALGYRWGMGGGVQVHISLGIARVCGRRVLKSAVLGKKL